MLKIKEGAEIYYQSNEYHKSNSLNRFDNIFKAGVEFAQRWISFEDELPSGYVTLKCKGSQTYVSVDFSGANDLDTQWLGIEYYKATHWRPIELK